MCGGLTFCPSLSRRGKCGVAQGTKEILKVSGYLWKDQNPVRRFSLTPTMNIVRAPTLALRENWWWLSILGLRSVVPHTRC